MSPGTKTLIFGSHQFVLHPLMVGWAWRKLYGCCPSWKEWFCIIIHDWGYWGKPNVNGEEGDKHPEWAGRVVSHLFGSEWGDFCQFHSRFVARQHGRNVSRLCAPDKLAGASWPVWLYVLIGGASGEMQEAMALTRPGEKYSTIGGGAPTELENPYEWYRQVADYLRRWAYEHADGRYDTWTQGAASQ